MTGRTDITSQSTATAKNASPYLKRYVLKIARIERKKGVIYGPPRYCKIK